MLSVKYEMNAVSMTQAATLVQLKRHERPMPVDIARHDSYSVSGLSECMHFPVPFHFAIDSCLNEWHGSVARG
jgi:hypothetical protein